MIPELLERIWENLLARTEGPMNLRFFIQPAMSLIFTIRAGIMEAKAGRVPQIEKFVFAKPAKRRLMIRRVGKDVGGVFVVGVVLDIIYQLIVVYGKKTAVRFYPLESLLVAFVLAILPYIIFRGLVTRLVRWFMKKKKSA